MCGRRTDPVTGKIYHMLYNPPPNDPAILKRLEHRSDDSEEKARVRCRRPPVALAVVRDD